MPLVQDLALCLRKLDYSETSQVLVVFGRSLGVVHVIAKGARRSTKAGDSRFSGGLDLLDLGDAVLIHSPDRELSQLTEWKLLNGHLGLRESLRTTYLAQYAAELVTLLFQQHDPHPLSFDDLADLVASLAGATDRSGPEELMLAFQMRLLEAAGIMPNLLSCGHCGKPGERGGGYFSPARSSVLCGSCFTYYPDSVNFHPALARLAATMSRLCRVNPRDPAPPLLSELDLPALTRRQTDPLNAVLLAQLAHVVGRFPRVADYLFAATPPVSRQRMLGTQPAQPLLEALPPRPPDPAEIAALEAKQISAEAPSTADKKPKKKKKKAEAPTDTEPAPKPQDAADAQGQSEPPAPATGTAPDAPASTTSPDT